MPIGLACMGCAGWGKHPSLERSSYRANKSKRLVTRVGEESHPIGNMNGAYWATFVELDRLPKFSSCTSSSLNGDDRVGEDKLAEQRKKERHVKRGCATARETGGNCRQYL